MAAVPLRAAAALALARRAVPRAASAAAAWRRPRGARGLASRPSAAAVALEGNLASAMINVMSGSEEERGVANVLRTGGAVAAAEALLALEGDRAQAVGPRQWHRVMESLASMPPASSAAADPKVAAAAAAGGGAGLQHEAAFPAAGPEQRGALLRRLFVHLAKERLVTARAVHIFLRGYGYSSNASVREVCSVLENMGADYGLRPHLDTCNIVLGVCAWYANLRGIRKVLRVMEREGHSPDVVTYSTLIQGYSRCQGATFDDVHGAYREILDRGLVPSPYTLNNMLDACGKFGKFRLLPVVWRELTTDGTGPLVPDVNAYASLTESFLRCGQFDRASVAFDAVLARGLVPNLKMCTVFARFCLGLPKYRKRASSLLVEWGAPAPGVRRPAEARPKAKRFRPSDSVDLESPAWQSMAVLLSGVRGSGGKSGAAAAAAGGAGGAGGQAAAGARSPDDDLAEARLQVWRWLQEKGGAKLEQGPREVAFLGALRGRITSDPDSAVRLVIAYRQYLDTAVKMGNDAAMEFLLGGCPTKGFSPEAGAGAAAGAAAAAGKGESEGAPPAEDEPDDRWE